MTSRDRDPGKIAGAFPSRAKGIMQNLGYFHDQVMSTARPDPHAESEAAMRAEANKKTSPRSPSRPSAATRAELTGVRERLSVQAWSSAEAMPHLCFPPDQYPQGVGPGSQWTCRCDAVWVADGIAWVEYPTEPSRTSTPLAPERWFYVEGGQLAPEDYRAQEGLYDWRPLGPYYVKLYRAMLDTLQGKGDVDWRDMG
jgi:hypothetical protein